MESWGRFLHRVGARRPGDLRGPVLGGGHSLHKGRRGRSGPKIRPRREQVCRRRVHQVLRGQKKAAAAAAERRWPTAMRAKIRFLAGRASSRRRGSGGGQLPQPGHRNPSRPAGAREVHEGHTALKNGDARQAVKPFTDANEILDTWVGHFDLGRAYLADRRFTQADSEFDRCIKRRGEALSLFLDEEPTYGFFPSGGPLPGPGSRRLQERGVRRVVPPYLGIRGKSRGPARR